MALLHYEEGTIILSYGLIALKSGMIQVQIKRFFIRSGLWSILLELCRCLPPLETASVL